MREFRISNEQAKLLAAGLYKSAVDYIVTAKRDSPKDYQNFKTDYISKQAARSSTLVKRRYTHNRPLNLGKPSKEFT